MPQRRDGIGGRISSVFELPGDVVMNLPRVTMIGNVEMLVENHRGLVRYDPLSITIGAGDYQMVVEGDGLVIETVDTEGISIRGTIARITLEV